MYYAIAAMILFVELLYGQTIEIKGTVQDEETKEGIPWVLVNVISSPKGTMTNLLGEFLAYAPSLPISIAVHRLGYSADTIKVSSNAVTVSLRKNEITLSEVEIIANDTYAQGLIKRVYDRITEQEPVVNSGKAFYRQVNFSDSQCTQVLEIFYETLVNNRGVVESAVDQGKFARIKRPLRDTTLFFDFINFSNFSLGTFTLSQSKDSPLSFLPFVKKPDLYIPIRPDVEEYFDLHTIGFFESGKRTIALIDFFPKSGIERPAFKGQIKIDTVTLQVLSIEQSIDDGSFSLFTNSVQGYYWSDYRLSFKATFTTNGQNACLLDMLECRLSFMERHEHFQDYKKPLVFESILTFYQFDAPEQFTKNGKQTGSNDLKNVIHADYNPDFWKKHESLFNEIPIEKSIVRSMMSKGFYGNLFPGGERLP